VTSADELVRSAARAETTGLLLDFDGTIAEIVPRPEDARPLAGMTEILDALVTRMTTVAIVSSRPVSFLRRALGQRSGLLLIGHSGIEREWEGTTTIVEEARPWIPVVEEAIGTAKETMPPGTAVEDKGLALTVHYRQHPERGEEVRERLLTLAEQTGLRVRSGKQALELGIPVPMDKGTVVTEIGAPLQWSAFAGDDSVDVAGLRAMQLLRTERPSLRTFGIGVVSDETPPDVLDAADLTVAGPRGLRELLRRLDAALDAGRRA
jgi:trehalose 6-phosphate phosphatase